MQDDQAVSALEPKAAHLAASDEYTGPRAEELVVGGFPPIRALSIASPFRWLAAGCRDMIGCGGRSLFYGAAFAVMGVLIAQVFAHAPQYLAASICGFLLVGPFLALGLYDLSRRIERRQAGLEEITASVSGRMGNIGILAVVLAVITLVWARASLVVFALFYTNEMPSVEGFLSQVVTLENIQFLGTYLCVGLLFAAIVFAVSWVAIPLMLDRDSDAISAMIISFLAMGRNMPVAVLWGMLIVALTIIGFATWYVGLVVVIPLIGHATWHAYREAVGVYGEPDGD